MSENEPTPAAQPIVSHQKIETITTDHEKIITALAPLIDRANPLVQTWQAAEIEKRQVAESANTTRSLHGHLSLFGVVCCASLLAAYTAHLGHIAIAEKIAISLFAFLGGIAYRR